MNKRDRPVPPDAAHTCPADRSRPPALQQQRTVVHTRPESRTVHPQGRRRYGDPGITSSCQRTRRGASNQRLPNRPSTTTTRGKPTLPKRTPLYNPTKRDRPTHSTNACRLGTLTRKASTCPAHATDTKRIPPTSPGRGPRSPDPRNPATAQTGTGPNTDLSLNLTLLSRKADP